MDVLLVDDEDSVRNLIGRILESAGYAVSKAVNGQDALDQLQRRRFDLIITDIRMPQMDGIELMKVIQNGNIPTMVLSAMTTTENVVLARKLGAVDFLVKSSFEKNSFLKRVEKATGKKAAPEKPAVTGVAAAAAAIAAAAAAPRPAPTAPPPVPGPSLTDIEKRLKRVDEIKALSFVATEIVQLASESESSVQELVALITRDHSITSKVLQLSNSAFFRVQRRVRTLDQAVKNIGFTQIRDLAIGVSVIEGFTKGSGHLNRIEFWKHSIATAVICRRLADMTKHPVPETAFLAGLLHDLGRVVYDEYFHDEYQPVMRRAMADGLTLEHLEHDMLGVSHPQLARKMLDRWKLPDAINDAITFHHAPYDAIKNFLSKDRHLLAIVHAGNVIAESMPVSRQGTEMMRAVDAGFFGLMHCDNPLDLCDLATRALPDIENLTSIVLLHHPESYDVSAPSSGGSNRPSLYIVDGEALLDAVAMFCGPQYYIVRGPLQEFHPSRAACLLCYVNTPAQAEAFRGEYEALRGRAPETPIVVVVDAELENRFNTMRDERLAVFVPPFPAARLNKALNKFGVPHPWSIAKEPE